MLNKATELRESKTKVVKDLDELKEMMENSPGFAKTMWCGSVECEDKIKQETSATIRCIPFEQEHLQESCVICKEKADKMVYIAKAY
jgi:prolyl-tRNA synthetase